jgi:hypothetical protein
VLTGYGFLRISTNCRRNAKPKHKSPIDAAVFFLHVALNKSKGVILSDPVLVKTDAQPVFLS